MSTMTSSDPSRSKTQFGNRSRTSRQRVPEVFRLACVSRDRRQERPRASFVKSRRSSPEVGGIGERTFGRPSRTLAWTSIPSLGSLLREGCVKPFQKSLDGFRAQFSSVKGPDCLLRVGSNLLTSFLDLSPAENADEQLSLLSIKLHYHVKSLIDRRHAFFPFALRVTGLSPDNVT